MTDLGRFLLGGLLFFLLVVIPVLWYLKRRGANRTQIVLYILATWIVWNLALAPIHEGSHLLVGRVAGLRLRDYQLIQHFWAGDFVRGSVSWEGGSQWQILLSCQAPYLIDGVIILLGFLLLRWRNTVSLSVGTLVLVVTFLRSVFDVAINYSADAVFGGSGDFRYLCSSYPCAAVHISAWSLMLLGAVGAMVTITPFSTRVDPSLAE